jgi:phosphoadenosine phosphosulfate reductase
MGYMNPASPAPGVTDLDERVAALNARYVGQPATEVLRGALRDTGRVALVSSFGAESVVLLHMLAVCDPARPVIFVDTEMLFPETLAYQREVGARLGLGNLRVVRSEGIADGDPDGLLHRRDPDACCALRKARPLDRALAHFDAWITGRKRFQSGSRANLEPFEAEPGTGRIKVNPLAHWTSRDVQAYMSGHDLPRHPLVAKGYPSIGCAPCTSPVAEGEAPRAGRWRDRDKEECGIHFVNGKAVRAGAPS